MVVGDVEELQHDFLQARDVSWIAGTPPRVLRAEVRIRYRHEPAAARIVPEGREFRVEFAEPQRAIAPGQAAVIYQGDKVVGGGFIAG